MAPVVKALTNPTVTESQITAIIDVMVAGFENDILGIAMTGGDQKLMKPLFNALVRAAALEGVLYALTDGSDDVRSAAIWFPPGVHFMATEAQRNAGWDAFMALASPETQQWWGKVDEATDKNWMDIVGNDYNDCWYGAFIATHPSHEKKGYGALVMKTGCAQAGRDNKIALLTTQTMAKAEWYQKLGYVLHHPILDFSSSQGPLLGHFLSWRKGGTNKNATVKASL